MERKQIILAIAVIILSLGGLMGIMACGKSATAPSDYTITVPGDDTFTVPAGSTNYRVYYRDYLVLVKDGDGSPKQGIKVKFISHGNAFGGFYSDHNFTTALPNPYEENTDSSGAILVNYRSAAFTSMSTEQANNTLGFRAQSGGVEAVHSGTVTVSAIE